MKILLALLLSCFSLLGAQSVTLAWNQNPETNLLGYKLYWGVDSRSYQYSNLVAYPTIQNTVSNLNNGTKYFFAVTAYTEDLESPLSDEVSYVVPLVAPQNLTIKVNLQASASPAGPWTNLPATLVMTVPTSDETVFYRGLLHMAK